MENVSDLVEYQNAVQKADSELDKAKRELENLKTNLASSFKVNDEVFSSNRIDYISEGINYYYDNIIPNLINAMDMTINTYNRM